MGTQTFRFVVVFIAVGVQVGLIVLGMGGLAWFYSHPALEALAIVGLVLLIASVFTEGSLSPGEREDRDNRWVLIAFGSISLLVSYLPPYTDRMGFWTIVRLRPGRLCFRFRSRGGRLPG